MAPRIDERQGFVIRIYAHDHGPPHVHVRKGDADLRVYLDDELEPVYVHGRMKASDERAALRIIGERRAVYLKRWMEIDPE